MCQWKSYAIIVLFKVNKLFIINKQLLANLHLLGETCLPNERLPPFSCRIEFQNKFYTGTGFKFLPFSFDPIREGKFDD